MAYSTQAQIEAILGRDLTSQEKLSLIALSPAVDAWIVSQTGTSFSGSTLTTKYYDANSPIVDFDIAYDVQSVALVSTDDNSVIYTYTEGTEYVLAPYNSEIKTYLEKRSYAPWTWAWYDDTDWWYGGAKRLAITAKFGYPDGVPDDIGYLASYVLAKILSGQSNFFVDSAAYKSEKIEGYERVYADVQTALAKLKDDETISLILDKYNGEEIFL